MTRVLVCGGRDYDDQRHLNETLDKLHVEHKFSVVIEGEARGADTLARVWAEGRKVEVAKFPADWKLNGRKAGPIRNRRMLVEGKPDLVVAFPGGTGTAHMVRIAREAGVKTIEI